MISITLTTCQVATKPAISSPARLAVLALGALMLVGCTNSKLVIGPLYNRLDDQMRSSFHELSDFNPAQVVAFEASVGTFHVWHRQAELPKYAALLNTIQASIAIAGQTSADDIRQWIATSESFTQAVRQCHPINYSFDLIRSMRDVQIDRIEERSKKTRIEHRKLYEENTPEQRVQRRFTSITKWASRIGFQFNATQKQMLRQTLTQQISLRRQYFALSDTWKEEFFDLARQQKAGDFDAQMAAHLNTLWHLLETAHPQQWRANRELWQTFAIRLVNSLTTEQRRTSSAWLAKMSRTLQAISKDKPSFNVGTDSSIGCLVDTFPSRS